VCLAAADDATRQRCVRALQAASAGSFSSSLQGIASAVALTCDMIGMQSLPAVNAVLAALGKAAAKGLDAKSLKEAGLNVKELKGAGFDSTALKAAGYDAAALKAAGFNLAALKDAGYDAAALKAAGFSATALKAAGFSIRDITFAGMASERCVVSLLFRIPQTQNHRIKKEHFLTPTYNRSPPIHTHTSTRLCELARTHTHTRARARARTHSHTHTVTHARAHTHTHTLSRACAHSLTVKP